MLRACWAGEYDLILTKSVSRFARNLVDCVSLVRRLKNHTPPIEVFFETDNLFTLSEDSELKLSLLATFAQEESVKIAINTFIPANMNRSSRCANSKRHRFFWKTRGIICAEDYRFCT